ncbi:MAG TPA: nuclear transport factor 2 family protein [Acidimicrobiia bacterium]
MPTPEQVRATVDAYVDAYRRNSREAALATFAPDAVWHDPVGQPPHVGHEGIGAFWDQAHAMADKIVLEPTDIIVCGNEAAMVFTINAHVGDGVMVFDAVETFEVGDDAKIVLLKAYWDMSRARPQAG